MKYTEQELDMFYFGDGLDFEYCCNCCADVPVARIEEIDDTGMNEVQITKSIICTQCNKAIEATVIYK